jgi:hypothetical protein
MDVLQLSRRMWEFNAWLEAQEGAAAERVRFSEPPHGSAYLTLDARSTSPAASLNRNSLRLCGTEGGLTEEGLREIVAQFRGGGIPRFFVWISPGPELERLRGWIESLGGQRVRWSRYPTLLHSGDVRPMPQSAFDIRQVGVAAFAAAQVALGDSAFEGFTRTLAKPGFHHFIAYDGARPIAAAALVKHGDLGYLTYAGTIESDRRRGAQSALIAARLALAKSQGCTTIVSQTLTLLEGSLANLQRAGFQEIYEQEVFEIALN